MSDQQEHRPLKAVHGALARANVAAFDLPGTTENEELIDALARALHLSTEALRREGVEGAWTLEDA